MIIHTTTNVLALPLVLCIWALDLYLFLTCARLILGKWTGETAARICHGLKPITDPLPAAVQGWLGRLWVRPVPGWAPWAVTLFAVLIVREVLLSIALSDL
jgi:hypothetical protein